MTHFGLWLCAYGTSFFSYPDSPCHLDFYFHASGLSGGHLGPSVGLDRPPPPPCDIPSGCCSFTGPWTVTRSSLRMLRRVAAFCRPLRPVLLRVSFPRSRSPVVGGPGAVLDVAGVV